MTYEEAIAYLEDACTFGIKPGLMRIHELLVRLGNPHETYKTVHVTGTNGKGSVTAVIANALTAAGRKTGRYTSPHLEEYTERMSIDGHLITKEEFAIITEEVKDATEGMKADGFEQPTEFEMLTAAAFLYFCRQQVEYAVIEVGLGGLLDSTNVITPQISAITNVAVDHTAYCGPTVEDIAVHKAGIIKEGIPVVTAATGTALEIIEKTARSKKAPLYVVDKEIVIQNRALIHVSDGTVRQKICIEGPELMRTEVDTPLVGAHQAVNAAVAVGVLRLLGKTDGAVRDLAIMKGFHTVYWPGRFQILSVSGKTMIIDGAHNPAGVESFCRTYEEVFGKRRRVFVFSVLADKEYDKIVRRLFRANDAVFCAPAPTPRTADPKVMADLIGEGAKACPSVSTAIDTALKETTEKDVCVVVGSLYIQGEVRRHLREYYGAFV